MHSIKTPWLIVTLVVLVVLAGALLKLSNRSLVIMQQRQMPNPANTMGAYATPTQDNTAAQPTSGDVSQQSNMQAQGGAAVQVMTPPAQHN